MKQWLSHIFFQIARFLVWLFYPDPQIYGAENLPKGPTVVIGNHAKVHGPIVCEKFFPGPHSTWTIGEMMHMKEVPDYAFQDFWSKKPAYCRWFFRVISYVIAPLAASIFNNADCIGVYHDSRIMQTLRQSIQALNEGKTILIMPEYDKAYNNIVCEFQRGFVDLASLYHRKYKEELSFVPMYTAPKLRGVYIGKPVKFDSSASADQERERICKAMQDAITQIARNLPEHTVVPYPNLPKNQYPTNKMIDTAFDSNGLIHMPTSPR